MGAYQYYEFQAVDHPLTADDQRWLRDISSRARITANSFVNTYDFGDLKGDPVKLMQRCFDLHLYSSNFGCRALMIRLPARALTGPTLKPFMTGGDEVVLHTAGDHVILDIRANELEYDADYGQEEVLLAALAPLRADVLGGDLRLLYLAWPISVESEAIDDDAPEPLPGLGPLTPALQTFAGLFHVDPNLVAAAAERTATAAPDQDTVTRIIAALPDREKTALLCRVAEADPLITADLRAIIRKNAPQPLLLPPRTAADLRARAEIIADGRAQAAAAAQREQARQEEAPARKQRQARIAAVAAKGEAAWQDVEATIERRTAAAYIDAVTMIGDLRELARSTGAIAAFERRLVALQQRHSSKWAFIRRLREAGPEHSEAG